MALESRRPWCGTGSALIGNTTAWFRNRSGPGARCPKRYFLEEPPLLRLSRGLEKAAKVRLARFRPRFRLARFRSFSWARFRFPARFPLVFAEKREGPHSASFRESAFKALGLSGTLRGRPPEVAKVGLAPRIPGRDGSRRPDGQIRRRSRRRYGPEASRFRVTDDPFIRLATGFVRLRNSITWADVLG